MADDDIKTREESINLIITSIAMEEIALSHVINAEGEKIQYAVGTLPSEEPFVPPTMEELTKLNNSVAEVLSGVFQTQTVLKSKLQLALDAPTMQGPTGPTGPTGPMGVQSAIIPFSSGEAVYLTTYNNTRSSIATVGQGNAYQLIGPTDPIMLPITTGGNQKQLAFSVPCNGIIRSISYYISISSSAVIGVTNILTAQLYYSNTPDNYFMPIEETKVQFTVEGAIPIGSIFNEVVDNLSFPITAQTRLILVFYTDSPDMGTSSLSAFYSGGLHLEITE